MRYLFVYIFVLLINPKITFSQTDKDSSRTLHFQISNFISTVKSQGNEFSNQFKVYVLYVYKNDSLDKGFNATISYIMNSYDYKDIQPKYFVETDNDIIIIKTDDLFKINNLKELNVQKITRYNEPKLVQKLFPGELGGVSYQPPSLSMRIVNGVVVNSISYENSDEMPISKSIYAKPLGEDIDIDLIEPK